MKLNERKKEDIYLGKFYHGEPLEKILLILKKIMTKIKIMKKKNIMIKKLVI